MPETLKLGQAIWELGGVPEEERGIVHESREAMFTGRVLDAEPCEGGMVADGMA